MYTDFLTVKQCPELLYLILNIQSIEKRMQKDKTSLEELKKLTGIELHEKQLFLLESYYATYKKETINHHNN